MNPETRYSDGKVKPLFGQFRRIVRDMSDEKGNPGTGAVTGVVTRTKPETKKPSLWRVVMLNDDYTPMEFVVYVLQRFFHKDYEAATQIMLHVHQIGRAHV